MEKVMFEAVPYSKKRFPIYDSYTPCFLVSLCPDETGKEALNGNEITLFVVSQPKTKVYHVMDSFTEIIPFPNINDLPQNENN